MLIKRSDKKKKINWGLSGLGKFSESAFIPAINLIRKAKLESVFSHDFNRAKTFAQKNGVSGFFDNYDLFLASDIDAVYIASSNHDHYEQVIKAANAGKHILCEKPLAITALQAAEMVDTCRRNNVKLGVNYVYRFHPFVQKAAELVKHQVIGKFLFIQANFNINHTPGINFRFDKEKAGGGAIRDLGTHMIDLFRFIGGEIEEIRGQLDNLVYHVQVEDFAVVNVKFVNGGYGFFSVAYNAKKAFNEIEITGHKGSLKINNLISQRFSSSKMTIMMDDERTKAFRKRSNKFLRHLKEVNNSIIDNTPFPVSGEEGLVNMRLMEELEKKCIF